MRRSDAEKIVGQPVWAWSGLNGVYFGILESIQPETRPWRGSVRIKEIVEYPMPGLIYYSKNFAARNPAEFNELRSFGATSIIYAPKHIFKDYTDSLKESIWKLVFRLSSVAFYDDETIQKGLLTLLIKTHDYVHKKRNNQKNKQKAR